MPDPAAPAFQKATKKRVLLRLALSGPSGSGKTYTALRIAERIAQTTNRRMAVIDTEHGSADRYADVFDFDTISLKNYAPANYIQLMDVAQKAGAYSVLVIDSISHAWEGVGGILAQVDKAKARSGGNSFAGWKDATPEQQRFVEAMLQLRLHLVVTMRSKQEYVLERDERTGKTAPKRVGMKPVQRDGIEYEFDVAGELDLDHNLAISKTRCAAIDGALVPLPGPEFADVLMAWAKGTEQADAEPSNASGLILPATASERAAAVTVSRGALTPSAEQLPAHRTGNPGGTPKPVVVPEVGVAYPPSDEALAREVLSNVAASIDSLAQPVERPGMAEIAAETEARTAPPSTPEGLAVHAFCGSPDGWLPRGQAQAAVGEREALAASMCVLHGFVGADGEPQKDKLPRDWPSRGRMLYGLIGDALQSRDECLVAVAERMQAAS